jgi:hypothetical protein
MSNTLRCKVVVRIPYLRYLKLSHLLYHRVPISRCAKINCFFVNETFGVMLISPDRRSTASLEILYTITLAIPSALVAFSLVNAELRMSARSETRRGYATAWQMVLALRRL